MSSVVEEQQHSLVKEYIPPKICYGLLQKGKYSDIGGTFGRFFSLLKDSSNSSKDSADAKKEMSGCCGATTMDGKVLGLYLDNPETTKAEDLRSYAAMEVDVDGMKHDLPSEFEKIEVGGGIAAVMTVNGSYSQLASAWQSFGKRVMEEKNWKFSTDDSKISQEVYIVMDQKDESKNITRLIMFLDEE